jgi:hypothetical protein
MSETDRAYQVGQLVFLRNQGLFIGEFEDLVIGLMLCSVQRCLFVVDKLFLNASFPPSHAVSAAHAKKLAEGFKVNSVF